MKNIIYVWKEDIIPNLLTALFWFYYKRFTNKCRCIVFLKGIVTLYLWYLSNQLPLGTTYCLSWMQGFWRQHRGKPDHTSPGFENRKVRTILGIFKQVWHHYFIFENFYLIFRSQNSYSPHLILEFGTFFCDSIRWKSVLKIMIVCTGKYLYRSSKTEISIIVWTF